ncbi:MAG TPA: hypothetical protein VNZ26_23245 [Vicinamibacterales bacterium]|jgi:hypothetical protein|nr:hypothetical protein [Vicinamibacterales bacterium]
MTNAAGSRDASRDVSTSQALLMELAAEVSEETAQRQKLQAERAAEIVPVTRSRITLVAMLIAVPVLIGLVVMSYVVSPASVVPDSPREALNFAIKQIENFREDYSKLPDTLIQAGPFTDAEFSYTKKPDGQYQLVVRKHGQVLTYDSPREGRR